MSSKWDIVENLGVETSAGKRPAGTRQYRVRVRGAVTSLLAVSLLLAVPVTSTAQCHVAGSGPIAAAHSPLPTPIVNIRRSSISRAGDHQTVDTRIGLTSRQLAVRFNAFLQPAAPEPEDDTDYSFF